MRVVPLSSIASILPLRVFRSAITSPRKSFGQTISTVMIGSSSSAPACCIASRMAAVVAIQALLFADGGITALGANLLTMAIAGPLIGRAVYVSLRRVSGSRGMQLGASFAAAWSACVGAALVAAGAIKGSA